MALHSTLQGSDLHGCKGIQYAEDLNTFNSHNWHNSGVQWNETAAKWIAKPSSAAGGGTYDSEADLTAVLNDNYAGSSQAAGRYYPSSLGKSLMNFSANKSLYANSANVRFRFAPSSLTDTRLDSIFNFSANKSLYANSANVRSRFVGSSASFGTKFTLLTNGGDIVDAYHVHSQYDAAAGGYPSGGSTCIQYKSGALNSHGGSYELTFGPSTKRFALTGNMIVKGSVSGTSISGGTLRVGNFFGNQISGIAWPAYPSAVSNRKYPDTISSNIRWRFPASSTAISRFADSSNVRSRFRASSASAGNHWVYVSSTAISGQWRTPLYKGKPTAVAGNCGQIIRTSGSGYGGTYVWVCCQQNGGAYEWDLLTKSSA